MVLLQIFSAHLSPISSQAWELLGHLSRNHLVLVQGSFVLPCLSLGLLWSLQCMFSCSFLMLFLLLPFQSVMQWHQRTLHFPLWAWESPVPLPALREELAHSSCSCGIRELILLPGLQTSFFTSIWADSIGNAAKILWRNLDAVWNWVFFYVLLCLSGTVVMGNTHGILYFRDAGGFCLWSWRPQIRYIPFLKLLPTTLCLPVVLLQFCTAGVWPCLNSGLCSADVLVPLWWSLWVESLRLFLWSSRRAGLDLCDCCAVSCSKVWRGAC